MCVCVCVCVCARAFTTNMSRFHEKITQWAAFMQKIKTPPMSVLIIRLNHLMARLQ